MTTTAGGPAGADSPREVVGVALTDDLAAPTRFLAARRTEPPALAGGWELPGGKIDPGETARDALHREVREELGVEIEVGNQVLGPLADGRWPLGTSYVLRVWWAVVTEGDPAPIEDHDELRWVDATSSPALAWLKDDRPIADVLCSRLVRC